MYIKAAAVIKILLRSAIINPCPIPYTIIKNTTIPIVNE